MIHCISWFCRNIQIRQCQNFAARSYFSLWKCMELAFRSSKSQFTLIISVVICSISSSIFLTSANDWRKRKHQTQLNLLLILKFFMTLLHYFGPWHALFSAIILWRPWTMLSKIVLPRLQAYVQWSYKTRKMQSEAWSEGWPNRWGGISLCYMLAMFQSSQTLDTSGCSILLNNRWQ